VLCSALAYLNRRL